MNKLQGYTARVPKGRDAGDMGGISHSTTGKQLKTSVNDETYCIYYKTYFYLIHKCCKSMYGQYF